MTASIQTKSNKYYIVLNWKSNGKRAQKWVHTGLSTTGNNKRKAEQKRLEILREWENKVSLNDCDMLFSDYLKRWLEDTKHTISENTYYSYRKTIYNSICPYFEQMKIKLCDLKPFHIQEFYNHKMQNEGVTANTVWHYHANISKALKYAYRTERIKENPSDKIELPKKEKHIANYYSAEELKTLLEKTKGSKIEMVVYLAAWFGLRRGEIIGLRWDCIDFENNTLSVIGTVTDKGIGSKRENLTYRQTTKTNSSLRSFPISDEVAKYLKELKAKQERQKSTVKRYNHKWEGFVCVDNAGNLISPDYVTRVFPKLCEQCGLRRIKLHELRHTNISLLVEAGAHMKDIQEWAGHSSYSTTANIYAHIQAKSKNKLMQTLSAVLEVG